MHLFIVIPAFNEARLMESCCILFPPPLLRIVSPALHPKSSWLTTTRPTTRLNWRGQAVIFEPVNQLGRARNAGAAEATGCKAIHGRAPSRWTDHGGIGGPLSFFSSMIGEPLSFIPSAIGELLSFISSATGEPLSSFSLTTGEPLYFFFSGNAGHFANATTHRSSTTPPCMSAIIENTGLNPFG
jgi:hypothetical protein